MIETIGEKILQRIVEKGQILFLEEEKGKVKSRQGAIFVNASFDRAWNVLTNFKRYPKFIPGIQKVEIEEEDVDKINVKFTIGVKIMGIGGTVKYNYKYILDKPRVEFAEIEGKKKIGCWEIISVDTKKIILYYCEEVQDIKTVHPLVRFIISKFPLIEVAFYVAPMSMLLKAMKEEMEK